MNKEISYEFIRYQLKAQKIDLKNECKKHGLNYRTIQDIIYKEKDMRISQALFFAEILKCDIYDLLREKY